ncbi:hypothetical protein C441_13260 [Haloferax sulfurifontis ATCC BAA-897]|uniref:Uncharacterized protein n=1 Tax=Haloferax sulfurifontis ATCC BAA-897 TaxID=662480 RepID=M0I094_9EURY|nr:hypothetical protein C441_13260 [Haloferax sulfurifontis ATCC BAA-897]
MDDERSTFLSGYFPLRTALGAFLVFRTALGAFLLFHLFRFDLYVVRSRANNVCLSCAIAVRW